LKKRILNQTTVVTFVFFFLLFGCFSNHYERTEDFQFLWKVGDLPKAELEAQRLAQSGPKRDRMLYYLEQGSVARMQGSTHSSIVALQAASREYERWYGSHLRTETRVSEEFLSIVSSPETKPYKSRIYERAMLRMYQAHNYLLAGEKGLARAAIFKTRQAIEDAKDLWREELKRAHEENQKRKINLEKTLTHLKSSVQYSEQMEKVRSLVPPNFPKFVNPATLYFEALYFLHGGSQQEDFNKAEYSLRLLASLFPDNRWIQEDYRLAKQSAKPSVSSTYVFMETGRAPVRVEKRIDLPIFFFSSTSRIPYLGIALPTLKINDHFLQNLDVFHTRDISKLQTTKPLSDIDSIVAQEFEHFYDLELTQAIAGGIAKGGVQYLATNSVRGESDLTKSVVGAGVGMLSQLNTRADLRSWSTLPKQIRFCKIDTPSDRKLTLRGTGTNLSTVVNLKKGKTQLVWVRSVSEFTPLRVVGVCNLSQI